MTVEDLRRLFADVESGAVTLTPRRAAREVYAGDVHYDASNGWQIIVFNDCDDFDYIDSVIAPTGECFKTYLNEGHSYDDPDPVRQFLLRYDPPEDVIRTVYGIHL